MGLNKPPICILSVLRLFQEEPRELGPLHWKWIVNCSLYPAEEKSCDELFHCLIKPVKLILTGTVKILQSDLALLWTL